MEVFDGHCDTILRCYLEGGGFRERPGHLDLTRTRKFSRYAQFFACFGEPEDMPGRPLWEVFQEEVALFRREMEQNADRVVFCRSGREAEAGRRLFCPRKGRSCWTVIWTSSVRPMRGACGR